MQPKATSLKVVAVVLALLAVYFAVSSVTAGAYLPALVACVGFVGALGLFSAHRRARFLVYVASAIVAVTWIATVVRLALTDWPLSGALESAIALVPGLLLLAICLGCTWLAAR